MSAVSISAAFAPARATGGGLPLSPTVLAIIAVVAIVGVLAIIGWRSPDRSPGADTKAERERIED
jgi:hypothetical protein